MDDGLMVVVVASIIGIIFTIFSDPNNKRGRDE
jgi:hypothetical protein